MARISIIPAHYITQDLSVWNIFSVKMLERVLFPKELASVFLSPTTITFPLLPWLPGCSELMMKLNYHNFVDTYGWNTSIFFPQVLIFLLTCYGILCILNGLNPALSGVEYEQMIIVRDVTWFNQHLWTLWMGRLRLQFRFPIHPTLPR